MVTLNCIYLNYTWLDRSTPITFTVAAALICELPSDYPTSVPPILSIKVLKGLSVDRGDELLAVAQKCAEENIGLPSIFTIAELVKEWLIDNNIPGQDGSMYSGLPSMTFAIRPIHCLTLLHHCCRYASKTESKGSRK